MATRNEVKQWFQTLDKPTQAQFWALFDSIYFHEDGIEMADVSGLVDALAAKASKSEFDSYVQGTLFPVNESIYLLLPANTLLEKVVFIPGADCTLKFTLDGSGEELAEQEVLVAEPATYSFVFNYFTPIQQLILVEGIPANSKIIQLDRKIKVA